MKITKQRNRTHTIAKWLIPVLVIFVLAGGYAAYAAANSQWPFTTSNTSDTNNSDNTSSVKTEDSTGNQLRDTPNPAPKTDNETGKSTVNMSITTASVSGNTLQVRTLIEYIASSGTCKLSMAGPNGATYTKSSDIYAQPSSTTCKGFDIPTSELTPGTWTITTTFTSGNITGTATKEITI